MYGHVGVLVHVNLPNGGGQEQRRLPLTLLASYEIELMQKAGGGGGMTTYLM
jgi:hypothetical protein